MARLAEQLPDDHEAQIFYALSLLGTAPPDDASFANQKKAAAILNGLLPLEPQHPGIAHYMIHSFDYPQLAAEALPAARAYSKIAPDSPHALHMPSHIFTRLGLWQDSIASNLASADAGRRLVAQRHPGAASVDTLHALDYLEYAYLQIGDEAAARRVIAEAAAAKTFDDPAFQAGYALAAIPARFALERRDWNAAAQLEPASATLPWASFPYAPATTYFAQAIGASRTGDLDGARSALRKHRSNSCRAAGVAHSGSVRLGQSGRVGAAGRNGVADLRRGAQGRSAGRCARRRRTRRAHRQASGHARARRCRRGNCSATCCSR